MRFIAIMNNYLPSGTPEGSRVVLDVARHLLDVHHECLDAFV